MQFAGFFAIFSLNIFRRNIIQMETFLSWCQIEEVFRFDVNEIWILKLIFFMIGEDEQTIKALNKPNISGRFRYELWCHSIYKTISLDVGSFFSRSFILRRNSSLLLSKLDEIEPPMYSTYECIHEQHLEECKYEKKLSNSDCRNVYYEIREFSFKILPSCHLQPIRNQESFLLRQ